MKAQKDLEQSSDLQRVPKTLDPEGLFNKQYVKTGKIPKDLARIYNDLFERRQEGDYIDFVSFQEAQVAPWIARAEQLIGYVTSLLEREIG